jgi:hypothetical protein
MMTKHAGRAVAPSPQPARRQAIGATTPAFTAMLGYMIMQQRESRTVYLSLVPVVVGVVIASGAEPMFNMLGFVAAVTAASARALKSVLQGLMLSDSNERMDSLSLLMYMAPVAVVALIPTTLIFEPDAASLAMKLGQDGSECGVGVGNAVKQLLWRRAGLEHWASLHRASMHWLSRPQLQHSPCPASLPATLPAAAFWGLLFLNSFLAYFVNLTNFLVTKHTSALTLQVREGQACCVCWLLAIAVASSANHLPSPFPAIAVTSSAHHLQSLSRL